MQEQYKRDITRCYCENCNSHFNVEVAIPQRYDSVLIRYCPLCGQEPRILSESEE